MNIEIERKFLVIGNNWKNLGSKKKYRQGYLSTNKQGTVRIRTIENQGFLTIKGKTSGISRKEFEYEIPLQDALELLKMCRETPLEKYRHTVKLDNFTWEIDEFLQENQGLVVAEIELETENQQFEKPDWLGEEVSEDPKFYNAQLVKKPFCTW